jgi:hypothetical protein
MNLGNVHLIWFMLYNYITVHGAINKKCTTEVKKYGFVEVVMWESSVCVVCTPVVWTCGPNPAVQYGFIFKQDTAIVSCWGRRPLQIVVP